MFDFSTLTIALLVAAGFGGMFIVIRSIISSGNNTTQTSH